MIHLDPTACGLGTGFASEGLTTIVRPTRKPWKLCCRCKVSLLLVYHPHSGTRTTARRQLSVHPGLITHAQKSFLLASITLLQHVPHVSRCPSLNCQPTEAGVNNHYNRWGWSHLNANATAVLYGVIRSTIILVPTYLDEEQATEYGRTIQRRAGNYLAYRCHGR